MLANLSRQAMWTYLRLAVWSNLSRQCEVPVYNQCELWTNLSRQIGDILLSARFCNGAVRGIVCGHSSLAKLIRWMGARMNGQVAIYTKKKTRAMEKRNRFYEWRCRAMLQVWRDSAKMWVGVREDRKADGVRGHIEVTLPKKRLNRFQTQKRGLQWSGSTMPERWIQGSGSTIPKRIRTSVKMRWLDFLKIWRMGYWGMK